MDTCYRWVDTGRVPFVREFRMRRNYRNEFAREWLLWEETKSVADSDLEMRIKRVRMIHNSAMVVALRRADAREIWGPRGDPQARAELEGSLLEPWAQQILGMAAIDVLTRQPS